MVNKFNQCLKQTNKQNKQSKTKSKPKTTQTKTNEKNTCELKSLNTQHTTYVDVHPGPGKELVCTFCGVKRVT